MGNTSWAEDASKYFLLLLAVTSGLSNLPPVTCNRCNTKTIIPNIEISSSPPSRTLSIGAAVNLTCEAWPSDRDDAYDRRWTKYIQWYDPQDRPVGAKCLQSTPKVLKLQCTLMLKELTLAQFGNYTCEAQNDYVGYCRRKSVEISLQDTQLPNVIEDPKNQSAVIGSSLTLNCTATGRPKPTITWIKNNDSYAVQSNPRAKVIRYPLDDKTIHSQLLITGVKEGDDGKYQCVADNSAGEKTSKVAFLHIKELDTKNIQIVEDPRNQSAVIGSDATLTCIASGRPKPTITWIKNNDSYAVQSNPRAKVIRYPLDDKTIHSQLLITGVKEGDDGKYQCVADNSAGEKTSKVAFLHIKELDTQNIRIVEEPRNQSTVIGSDVTLNCIASGRPKPTITWIKNNDSYAVQSNPRAKVIRLPLDDNTIYHQLLITGVKKEDGSEYQCVANNGAEEIKSKVAFLYIKDLESQSCTGTTTKLSTFQMSAITVSCAVASAVIFAIGVVLWRRRCKKPGRLISISFHNKPESPLHI